MNIRIGTHAERGVLLVPDHLRAQARVVSPRLLSTARRTGTLQTTPAGRGLGVFSAGTEGELFEIVTRPLGGRRHTVLSITRAEERPEEEVRISASYNLTLTFTPPVPIPNPAALQRLPAGGAALYFIYVDSELWYLGKATDLRGRFQARFKTFHDFKIPSSAYEPWTGRVRVGYALLTFDGPATARGIKAGDPRKGKFRTITSKAAGLLRIAEQVYLKRLNPRGNSTTEPVVFEPGGTLTIRERPSGRVIGPITSL